MGLLFRHFLIRGNRYLSISSHIPLSLVSSAVPNRALFVSPVPGLNIARSSPQDCALVAGLPAPVLSECDNIWDPRVRRKTEDLSSE
ncbi:Hypothetical protein NTJ_12530 [Nesidiocoris tenuis]|uniref:Uncharacterized protein n=1 Tax=Nesidiocoris tenuis TaxID=355587 RepID=A0ABN7B629_9HEMI|nr:Hypothetical protein NTJ_12530 [Nesidiocoris tenuis]